MGMANHHLGNKEKAKSYFKVIQTLYGKNQIEKLKKGNSMWNKDVIFIEREMDILIPKYNFK